MVEGTKNSLETAVRNFNANVVDVADNLASLPNAAARLMVDKLHGEGAAEKVAGRFDERPVSSFVAKMRQRGPREIER